MYFTDFVHWVWAIIERQFVQMRCQLSNFCLQRARTFLDDLEDAVFDVSGSLDDTVLHHKGALAGETIMISEMPGF